MQPQFTVFPWVSNPRSAPTLGGGYLIGTNCPPFFPAQDGNLTILEFRRVPVGQMQTALLAVPQPWIGSMAWNVASSPNGSPLHPVLLPYVCPPLSNYPPLTQAVPAAPVQKRKSYPPKQILRQLLAKPPLESATPYPAYQGVQRPLANLDDSRTFDKPGVSTSLQSAQTDLDHYVFRARKPNAPDDEPAVRQRHPKRRGPGPLQGEVPPEPTTCCETTPLKEWGRKVVINLSICHHPQRKLQARKGSNLTRLNLSNSLFTCGFVLLASTFLFYLPVRGEPDLEVVLGAPALTPSSTDGIYTNDEDIQALSEPGGLLEGLSTRQSVQLAIDRVELLTSTEAPYHQHWETYLIEYEQRLAEMGEAPPTQAEVANIQALWAPLESLTLAQTTHPEDVANESIPVSQISPVTAAGMNTSLDLTALPVVNSTVKANGLLNQLLAAAATFPNRTAAQDEVQTTIIASPEPGTPSDTDEAVVEVAAESLLVDQTRQEVNLSPADANHWQARPDYQFKAETMSPDYREEEPLVQGVDRVKRDNTQFVFDAYDCSNPVSIEDVGHAITTNCVSEVKTGTTTVNASYQLLQVERTREAKGYSCSVAMSSINLRASRGRLFASRKASPGSA
ncbi:unnamed protein product [Sphagnum tenellum]